MWLVYSYTSHLNRYTDNTWVATYFKASIRRSKSLGYKVRMYGCNFMYNMLAKEVDDFINIDNLHFDITDDLKIYIHGQEGLDCLTIDGDIILEHKLQTPISADIIFDRRSFMYRNVTPYKKELLDVFLKFNVTSQFPQFRELSQYTCNVGILKFNSQEVKDKFISSYYELKDFYLKQIHPYEELENPSLIVCEYNFERLAFVNKYKTLFLSDYNSYTHYFSRIKLEDKFKTEVHNILNLKETNII